MALLARASRFGSASHSHADQGSFSLFYEGTALITPSGYFGFGWGTKHHINWTNATKAHNTILVNGLGQLTFSEKPVGEIEYCEQSGNIFKAGLNLSDAYDTLDNWRRTFTMDGQQNTLIIEDKIAAENEITLDWCLHSLSLPKLNDNIVTIERNGIKLTVEVLSGLNPQVYITDKFGTDLNEGVSEEDKVDMPKQYHMNWKTKRAKEHNIVVKLSIKKL